MSVWTVIILGIVEGLTEFLPVSSTGHLILAGYVLNFTGEEATSFEIVIQLGAILSVIVYFRRRLLSLIVELPVNPVSQASRSSLAGRYSFCCRSARGTTKPSRPWRLSSLRSSATRGALCARSLESSKD